MNEGKKSFQVRSLDSWSLGESTRFEPRTSTEARDWLTGTSPFLPARTGKKKYTPAHGKMRTRTKGPVTPPSGAAAGATPGRKVAALLLPRSMQKQRASSGSIMWISLRPPCATMVWW